MNGSPIKTDYQNTRITNVPTYPSTLGASTSQPAATSDFRDLVMLMMLSNFNMPGQSQGDETGSGMSALIAPLMLNLLEKLLAGQVETDQTSTQTFTQASTYSPTPQGKPVEGPLTQGFHPGHNGLDFGVPVGTSVKATMDGKVVYAGWNDQGYGNLVIVENGPYRTYYAHLSEIPVVIGQSVQAGSVIGLSGNTGNSTGPHVHYEVRKDGQPIDPTGFTLA